MGHVAVVIEVEMHLSSLCVLAAFWFGHACLAQDVRDCEQLVPTASDETIIAWYSGVAVRTGTAPGRIVHNQRVDPNSPLPATGVSDYVWETRYGPLRAIAVIQDGEILEARDTFLSQYSTMQSVIDAAIQVSLKEVYSDSYLYREGIYWCRFSAATDPEDIESNTLFTNDPDFSLRPPTSVEQADFDRNIYPQSYCANHAGLVLIDVASEDVPPCDAPKLIGVSDVDSDLVPEYWATEILRYSTGLAVWERAGLGSYRKLFSSCPGCAD